MFVIRGAIGGIGKGNWIYIGVLSHAINFEYTPEAHESFSRNVYDLT